MKAKGFSDAVIERMQQIHSVSTNKVYKSQWRLFESWCIERGHNPLNATSVLICDFFLYLFKDRQIRPSSIEGYKSAITFFLRLASGYDLSSCSVVADLIRSFKREKPIPPRVEVKWDISLVLRFLQSETFRPESVSMRNLSLKTLFLVALAAGRRRSELHALERDSLVFQPGLQGCAARPHPRFLSKTHITTKGVSSLRPVVIPALPPEPADVISLCPVRTLRLYVDRSDVFRSPEQKALFLSYSQSVTKDISPQTVSKYIRHAVIDAYRSLESASDDVIDSLHVKAHQVRHVAHSLGQLGNLSLTEIIRTGDWTQPSTFVKHYLQHVSADLEDKLSKVGPFVAIESVLPSSPS